MKWRFVESVLEYTVQGNRAHRARVQNHQLALVAERVAMKEEIIKSGHRGQGSQAVSRAVCWTAIVREDIRDEYATRRCYGREQARVWEGRAIWGDRLETFTHAPMAYMPKLFNGKKILTHNWIVHVFFCRPDIPGYIYM